MRVFIAPPSLADIRKMLEFWNSDDAPGSIAMRDAVISELEWAEFQWLVLSN